MAYPPIAIANTLIARHAASGGITHKQIQTLCYLLYGWSIPILGKPLHPERLALDDRCWRVRARARRSLWPRAACTWRTTGLNSHT